MDLNKIAKEIEGAEIHLLESDAVTMCKIKGSFSEIVAMLVQTMKGQGGESFTAAVEIALSIKKSLDPGGDMEAAFEEFVKEQRKAAMAEAKQAKHN